MGHEDVVAGDGDVVQDADEPDVPAGAGGADGLHHRLLRSDRLHHGVRTESVGEFLDLRDPGLAAFLDDVGGAELAGQGLPVGVPGHGDDPFGAELLGGQDGEQPDGPVTDHGDGLAGAGLGRHGAEPAGAEHIGGGQQAGDQVLVRLAWGGDERAVGQRHPHQLRLRRTREVARATQLVW